MSASASEHAPREDAPAAEVRRAADAVPREGQTPDLHANREEVMPHGGGPEPDGRGSPETDTATPSSTGDDVAARPEEVRTRGGHDAPETPDPEAEREAIEAAAEAMWQDESLRARDRPRAIAWSDELEQTRDRWRRSARIALIAAGYSRTASEIHRLREIVSEREGRIGELGAGLKRAADDLRACRDAAAFSGDRPIAAIIKGLEARARALLQEAPDAEGQQAVAGDG